MRESLVNTEDPDHPPDTLYSPMIESAIRLAAQGHYHQFRKRDPDEAERALPSGPLPEDIIPYITHLMGTMCILARLGVPDEVLAASVLHDYLEDVPDPDGRFRIREATSEEVLELVTAVTEDKRPELDKGATWELRKSEQLENLRSMPEKAVLVKCADVLHNLLTLERDLAAVEDERVVWNRLNAGPEKQYWYFSRVLDEARRRLGDHPLINELESTIDRLPG
jgi:(p)ppGpp synthase/HD superfamily hydrolase